MARPSLRFVVAALCAATGVAVAVVTVTIFYSMSISAFRSSAEKHAMSLVAAVQLQVTREMRPIACSVQSLQKMIGIGQFVILQQPADYGVYEWSRVVLEPLTEAYVMQKDWTSFHGALGMYFADGSHVRVSAQPNSSEYMVVYEYDARLGSVAQEHKFFAANGSIVENSERIITGNVPRSQNYEDSLLMYPPRPDYSAWTGLRVLAVEPLVGIGAIAWLYNSTGHLLGLAYDYVEVTSLQTFVLSKYATPNTRTFIIDKEDTVVAASHPLVNLYTERAVASLDEPLLPTCSRKYYEPFADTCRVGVKDYPYVPLQSMAGRFESYAGALVRRTVGGVEYLIAVRKLESRLTVPPAGVIVIVVPESDFTKTAQRARTFGIVFSLVALALLVPISVLLSYWILRPLHTLVDRLHESAKLKEELDVQRYDPVEEDCSIFEEIHALQVAYNALHTELKSLRAFVPDTLMQDEKEASNLSNSLVVGTQLPGLAEEPIEMGRRSTSRMLNVDRLTDRPNQYRTRYCSVVLVQIFAAASNDSLLVASPAQDSLSKAVPILQSFGGTVDTLSPMKVFGTFNAHAPCPCHESAAVRCAVRLHDCFASRTEYDFAIAVDSGSATVGLCGDTNHSATVVLGQPVETVEKLIELLHDCMHRHLAVTERSIDVTTRGTCIPIDVVGLCASVGRVHRLRIYEPLTGDMCPQEWEVYCRAYDKMVEGEYAESLRLVSSEQFTNSTMRHHAQRLEALCRSPIRRTTKTGKELAHYRAEQPLWGAVTGEELPQSRRSLAVAVSPETSTISLTLP